MLDRLLTQLQAYQEENKDARDATIRLGRFSFPLRFFGPAHITTKYANSLVTGAVVANALADNWWPVHVLGYMMQTKTPLSSLANIGVPFTTVDWTWGNKLVLWDSSRLPWPQHEDNMLPLCPLLGSPSRDARRNTAVPELMWHLLLHDQHTGGEIGELLFADRTLGVRTIMDTLFLTPNDRMMEEASACMRDTARFEWGSGRATSLYDPADKVQLAPVLNSWVNMAARMGPVTAEKSFALLAVTDTWNAQQTTRMC